MTPEPLPREWLLDRLDTLQRELLEHSRGVREDMNDGFLRLDAKLDSHAEKAQIVSDRVLVIETRRSEEDKRAMRRGALAGVLAATGLTVAWEAMRNVFGWPR